jgi:hypothetical protein
MIKNWWNDSTFRPTLKRNPIVVKDVYWWRAPSHPSIDLATEVIEWLNENVEGKYHFDWPTLFLSPSANPREVECEVFFSRSTDAIKFKLSFG